MSGTTTTTSRPNPSGKFTKSEDKKRSGAARHLFLCFLLCAALWAGIYTAQATNDMSARLALGLAAVVLACGSFYFGAVSQAAWGGAKNG